jgi:O-methyltransferase
MVSLIRRFLKATLDSYGFLRITEVFDRRCENRIAEFGVIAHAMEFAKINGVEGDYFEFGIWQGKTFKYAHKMRRRYALKNMTLRGFDSFQGLPSHADSKDSVWYAGQFAYSRDELERDLRASGFAPDDYELVAGYYDDSLNDDLVRRLMAKKVKAAVVYIDCDLYESTCAVLKFVVHFLQNGTIVCFDDYYNYRGAKDQGEARALGEFLRENPHIEFIPYVVYAPLGQSFIARVKE